jgi:hypothetical protein
MLFADLEGSLKSNLSLANAPKARYRDPLTCSLVVIRSKFPSDLFKLSFATDESFILAKRNRPVCFQSC